MSMSIFYVADLLIAFSFASLNFNPFEIAFQLQSTTEIVKCWTGPEEWQECSLWCCTGTWTSVTKPRNRFKLPPKITARSVSRAQNKYAACLEQQMSWLGALLREVEWRALASLPVHPLASFTLHKTPAQVIPPPSSDECPILPSVICALWRSNPLAVLICTLFEESELVFCLQVMM